MRMKSQLPEPDSPDSPSLTPQERRQHSALHIILGLALLFLAGTLLVGLVRRTLQAGVTFTMIIGLLGFVLFCTLGFMLLGGELRCIFKKIAAGRRARERTGTHRRL